MTDINSIDNSHLTDGIFSVESLIQTGEEGYLQNHDAYAIGKKTDDLLDLLSQN